MKKSKTFCLFVAGIILFIILIILLEKGDYAALSTMVSLWDFSISICFLCLIFFLNGMGIAYLTRWQFGVQISPTDILVLPIMMGLWGYIIPFRGGVLFSALLLKAKYKISLARGVSIGIYTFMITLMLTGIFGLYYAWANSIIISVVSIVSSTFILSPLLIKLISLALPCFPLENHRFLKRVQVFCTSAMETCIDVFKKTGINAVIICLTLVSTLVHILWLYWMAKVLDIHATIANLAMLTMILKLSIIIRIVPGNIGVQELMSGGAFYLLGGSLEEGVLIAVFMRLSSLFLVFSIGIAGVVINMKYFKVNSFTEIWEHLKGNQSNKKN